MRRALPGWFEWPRELRRVYMLLDSHGATDVGLDSICKTLGYERAWLNKVIKKVPSFQAAFDEYAKEQQYPIIRTQSGKGLIRNRARLKLKELAWLFNNESALIYLVALEQETSRDKLPLQHAARMVAGAGFIEQVSAVGEPEPTDDDEPAESALVSFEDMSPVDAKVSVRTEPVAEHVP